jgi:ABC-type glycerol-3-phosphate transport system permease component
MAAKSWRLLRQLPWYGLMLVAVFAVGLPLFWVATGSLKTTREIYIFPPVWLPEHPRWGNFTAAWHAAPFGRFYLNSIIVTLADTAAKLFFALTTAYALVFLKIRGRNLVFLFVLAALFVPAHVTLLPNYLTVGRLGWINTYFGLIVPMMPVAFGTFLFRQHFRTLSREVLDAALIDGCGHWRLLWNVVLPMSRPVAVTVGLLAFVGRWNDFLWPLVVTNTVEMRTLPVGITYLYQVEGVQNWGPIFAGTLFVMVPVLLLYIVAQRWIISGISSGAVKG